MSKIFSLGRINFGKDFVIIAGPCVIESRDHVLFMAKALLDVCQKFNLPFVFKSSYDKANRSSINSYRGPGLNKGLKMLLKVKEKFDIPVLSDIHSESEVKPAAEVLDILQIPALLCRQTDLIVAAAKTKKPLNIKKGQFLAPHDMQNVVRKATSCGNKRILITERGTTFGYNNLVADMRSLYQLRQFGYPVIFDATHASQFPGALGKSSGGERKYVEILAKAAVAAGCDGLFLEVHHKPQKALCDGPNMIDLKMFEKLLVQVSAINNILRK
jgi:2-dehydro-3-deoxyphosphooctonate aldolase (KDO 8-P synthase)